MSGRLFAGTLLAFLLAGCASGATSTAAPSGVMASPTAEASLAPSSTPAARVYPYTLPWPAEELEAEWRYAVTPWDGAARIDHGNKYTDSVRTEDGDLFAFGYETSKSAVELQAMVAEQASKWHGCDEQPT